MLPSGRERSLGRLWSLELEWAAEVWLGVGSVQAKVEVSQRPDCLSWVQIPVGTATAQSA